MTIPEPKRKSKQAPPTQWEEQVAEKEARKLRARRRKERSIWFGLGAFGVVGWSVVIPALLGLFLGIWIDRTWPSAYSFTLMLFLGGLFVGLYNAWRWLLNESGLIEREHGSKDDDNDD